MFIKCSLNDDGCVDLETILRVINQVNQEQVWAIGYQVGVLMQRLNPSKCAPIVDLAQIQIHKDGLVHEKTCSTVIPLIDLPTTSSTSSTTTTTPTCPASPTSTHTSNSDSPILDDPSCESRTTTDSHPYDIDTCSTTPPITPDPLNELLTRRPAANETELVASLGIALFRALDYGIPDDEERKLSYAMEYLIYQSQSKLSLDEVLELCINRLPVRTKSHADLHYREVCKSLISDTIELSIFLEKIYTASMVLSDITLDNCLEAKNHHHKCDISDQDLSEFGEPLASLRALRINDWARLWMQVIRELRQRGRFKQALSVN